jgi:hypothetical protein
MQHMVKGKNLFFKTALIFLPIYIIFLLDDFYNFNDHGVYEIINARNEYIKQSENINSIIIGGSNALWGISADQLNNLSNNKFYNLSMHSNGVNYENYFEYILQSVDPIQAKNIDLIIWSSVHLFFDPPYNDFDRDIAGRLRQSKLIPNQSLLSKIYQTLTNQESVHFEVSPLSGDFLFSNFKCPLSDERYLANDLIDKISKKRLHFAPLGPLDAQIQIYKTFFKRYFPNAKIVYVVPSVLNPPEILSNELKFLYDNFDKENFSLLIQQSIQDVKYLCEDAHHPNAEGRKIRTTEIYEFLKTNKFLELTNIHM